MANRNLALSKGIFSYALRVGLLEHSPASQITPPGKEIPKDRVLSQKELKFFLEQLSPAPRDIKDIFLLILLTAQRPGEVCSMRVDQIRGDWWHLSGKETKSGRPHRVYLATWTKEIIQSRLDDALTKDYIFPAAGQKRKHIQSDNLKNWLHHRLYPKIAATNIGTTFTAHDLRRTAATGMAEMGFAAIVPDILNHAPQGITRTVYDKYDRAPEIKRALSAWEARIKQLINGGSDNKVIEIHASSNI
jgi:integrase